MPTATVTDLRAPCLCGCGELPNEGRRWIRGHASRGAGGFKGQPAATVANPLVPSQEDADAMTDADWDALEAEGPGVPDPLAEAYEAELADSRVVEEIGPGFEPGTDDLRDAPPAHGQRSWAGDVPGAPLPKVTQAIRRDVAAKIGIPLAIAGALYEMRDPYCGGAFQSIRRDLAAEFADLACDSPTVLAFFLGRGGAYMRYLNIVFTLLPWAEMLAAHHVTKTVGHAADGHGQAAGPPPAGFATAPPAPDFARYPA
jgi:hypothetical protein